MIRVFTEKINKINLFIDNLNTMGDNTFMNIQEILEQIEDLLCEILNHSSDFDAVTKAEEAHRLLEKIKKD